MTPVFECYRDIIPDFSHFEESLRKPLPTHLRLNSLKAVPDTVMKSLVDKGIRLERSVQNNDTLFFAPNLVSPGNLLEYFLGYIQPQALTPCLTSLVLSPGQGRYVLDMCAAPGGKTSHVAQLMNNSGLIVANELYPSRHIALGNTLDRLGVLNAVVTGYQAQEFPLKQKFDYVLADVPCSGEGTFRRTKEGRKHRVSSARMRLPELQKKIILRGFDLLKANGVMLYATCTYNPEENEDVIEFLLENRDAELLPLDVPMSCEVGLAEWRKTKYDRELEKATRFYPHRIDSVGFFMARIGRKG